MALPVSRPRDATGRPIVPGYPGVAPTGTTEQLNTFQQMAKYLSDAGLGGLFSVDANGTPSGWLWNEILSGVDDQAVLQLHLENTTQFQTRYGIITELRKRAGNGEPVHVPTVAEVREYEDTVSSLFRQAGLPTFMYDDYTDAQQYMRLGLSATEIEQRVGQTFERVQNTDPLVRAAFSNFFGVAQGDAALASFYLDPTRTQANLDRMSRTAYTAGMGQRMGITLDQATADRIAGSPSTDAGIYTNLGQLSELDKSGIFSESLGEGGTDLTTQGAGVDAAFFGDSSAIEKRVVERQSARAAVPGGAARTNKGLIGVGTANT